LEVQRAIKITITEDDMRHSDLNSYSKNPIAIAMKRLGFPRAEADENCVWPGGRRAGCGYWKHCQPEIGDLMSKCDRGENPPAGLVFYLPGKWVSLQCPS